MTTSAASTIADLTRDLARITAHYRTAIEAAAHVEGVELEDELSLSLATVGAITNASQLAESMNALARRATDGAEELAEAAARDTETAEAEADVVQPYRTSSPFVASLVALQGRRAV